MPDIKFTITEHIDTLSTSTKGWTKELNKVSWNNGAPKMVTRPLQNGEGCDFISGGNKRIEGCPKGN